ncbi:hypothetical protein [Virgibacillus kimchii]
MGRQIKGLLYFFIMDLRYSLMIFWGILLGILVVSLTFAYFLTGVEGETNFIFFLTIPMYVYAGIVGYLTIRDFMPFSIKMGATRKNMFIAIGIFFFLISAAKSLFATILQELVEKFNAFAGIDIFTFLHFAHLLENNWYTRIIIDTAVMFFAFMVMLLIRLLIHRFGLLGAGSVLGLLAVLLLLAVARGWIFDFFRELFTAFEIGIFYQVFGIGLLLYFISFLFIKRIEVR